MCVVGLNILVHSSCWQTTDSARPIQHIAGVNKATSLIEEQEQHSAAGQTEPDPLGGRSTVLMSAQLSLTLGSLQSQAKQICEQVLSDKHRIEQITAQLEEDDKMQKALAAQVQALRAGRTEAVEKMQKSLSTATKDGHETLEKGSLLELQATDQSGLEQLMHEDGVGNLWDPVSEKSIQAEDLLNLLTLQEAKVSIQIEQGKLDKEELTSNIAMHKVMLKATLEQLRTLQAGRTDGLLAISNAFVQSYKALAQDDSEQSKPTPEGSTSSTRPSIAFVTEVCEAQISGGTETEGPSTEKTSTKLIGERADDSEDLEIKKTVLLKTKSAELDPRALKETRSLPAGLVATRREQDTKQKSPDISKNYQEPSSPVLPPSKALFAGGPDRESLELAALSEGAREAAQVSDKIMQEVNQALEAEKERAASAAAPARQGPQTPQRAVGSSRSVAADIDRADDSDFLQVRTAESRGDFG